ncbi:MAG: ABC transporter ATP-binding protein [Anaerolineaceae bacterium]|nr:ABC transporter ATP-binding protein [Anaerolineaceae bacterium]
MIAPFSTLPTDLQAQPQPIIEVIDVYKTYHVGDTEFPVLRGVSFNIFPGEFVAIVGPSGNGKTTLLNMMSGIDHPSRGEVRVNRKTLNRMSEDQLSQWRGSDLGIVFQFFQLLPALSLLQNIILPMDFLKNLPPRHRREHAYHLLQQVGLADQAHKMPSAVSGGQQQRAAIARALANDPPVILADEPTGNLDAKTSAEVFDLFIQLSQKGKTLVMVTHNMELARRASRILEVVNGQIVRDEKIQ